MRLTLVRERGEFVEIVEPPCGRIRRLLWKAGLAALLLMSRLRVARRGELLIVVNAGKAAIQKGTFVGFAEKAASWRWN